EISEVGEVDYQVDEPGNRLQLDRGEEPADDDVDDEEDDHVDEAAEDSEARLGEVAGRHRARLLHGVSATWRRDVAACGRRRRVATAGRRRRRLVAWRRRRWWWLGAARRRRRWWLGAARRRRWLRTARRRRWWLRTARRRGVAARRRWIVCHKAAFLSVCADRAGLNVRPGGPPRQLPRRLRRGGSGLQMHVEVDFACGIDGDGGSDLDFPLGDAQSQMARRRPGHPVIGDLP